MRECGAPTRGSRRTHSQCERFAFMLRKNLAIPTVRKASEHISHPVLCTEDGWEQWRGVD